MTNSYFWLFGILIQASIISARIYNVNYNEVKELTKTLTLDNPNHVLLDSSHTVMRPAVHNFTQALDRIVVHFLLYHDSIRHSSRECAAQIHSDSMKKLISSTELGYDCLKELVTFVRRSSIQSEAQLSPDAQHTINHTFGECIRSFEDTAEKKLENAWPNIKYCSYQEIGMNSVDLDPTGITAKIRENLNNNN